MKKTNSLLLALVLCLSLCACGKSEEVKNAELQIDTLTADSTYQEIYDVYSSYMDVKFEDRQKGKVENEAELAKYCDLLNGHFVLNDAMIDSIEGKFEDYGAFIAIKYALYVKEITQGWTQYSDIEIASVKQVDDYTIVGYGSLKIMDKYGDWSSYKLEIEYFAEYDEEDEKGYSISEDVRFFKK
ncbi:MAG: hypothetical protein SPE19_04725 [Candidatus Faecousia sp.]|nr:hypothetical protein [Candidatus Faecousia sp.]